MNDHSTNYFDTFIAVADDCPVDAAEVPPHRDPPTAASLIYEKLIHDPYRYTSDDVVYTANGTRRGQSRAEFFAKAQPCLRSSALGKRYGWGVHCNNEGKVAIYAVDSEAYRMLASNGDIKQLRAMSSRRKKTSAR
jgi:hypothetical protein